MCQEAECVMWQTCWEVNVLCWEANVLGRECVGRVNVFGGWMCWEANVLGGECVELQDKCVWR